MNWVWKYAVCVGLCIKEYKHFTFYSTQSTNGTRYFAKGRGEYSKIFYLNEYMNTCGCHLNTNRTEIFSFF
jgi:hypothetical protein